MAHIPSLSLSLPHALPLRFSCEFSADDGLVPEISISAPDGGCEFWVADMVCLEVETAENVGAVESAEIVGADDATEANANGKSFTWSGHTVLPVFVAGEYKAEFRVDGRVLGESSFVVGAERYAQMLIPREVSIDFGAQATYIRLTDGQSASDEVSDSVVLDLDAVGDLIGIERLSLEEPLPVQSLGARLNDSWLEPLQFVDDCLARTEASLDESAASNANGPAFVLTPDRPSVSH